MTFKKILKLFFNRIFLEKFIAYGLLILFFYFFQDFLLVFFLTFLFAYLFLSFWKFLKHRFDIFINSLWTRDKTKKSIKRFFWVNIIIIFEYLLFISILIFTFSDLIPKLSKELSTFIPKVSNEISVIPDYIPFLKEPVEKLSSKLDELNNFNSKIEVEDAHLIDWSTIVSGSSSNNSDQIFSDSELEVIKRVWENIKSAWIIFFEVLLALVLSYIFIMDRHKLQKYLKWIQSSNFKFIYDEYDIILNKIVKSFWLIFKAQAMIATANAVLTTLWLYFIWLFYPDWFPFVLTLAVVVFIFWFIPVFGTFISSVPILIIAFSMPWGWYEAVWLVIALIAIVHAVEAYYLNPKIVSSFMEFPVSVTFIILLVSEHFFGFAWLIIGISSFYLLVEIFKDLDFVLDRVRSNIKSEEDIKTTTKTKLKTKMRMSRNINI